MADIKIIIDTTDLVDAKKKLSSFQKQMGDSKSIMGLTRGLSSVESNIKKLVETQNKGQLSSKSFKQGLLEQKRALVALGVSSQKASVRVEALARELRNQAATKAAAIATKELATEERKAAQAAKELSNEEERLKNKFVAGYTAMNTYSKELNDLAVARKRGIITTDEQTAAVARLNTQMKAGTGAFASAGRGMQQTARKTNQLGVMMQQTGYQVGDFAVQVGSGQNVMVAFGQQATQLVGTMAMFAKTTKLIALFSGLGIAIPVITGLVAAFMRTKGAVDDSSLAVKAFEERLKSAKEETVEMTEKLRFLKSGFGSESEFALQEDFAAANAELGRLEASLAFAKGPNTYYESEANKLASIGLIEESIELQKQEKELAETALQTYLDTLSALELEEFQREENLRLQKESEIAAENYKDLVEKTTRSQGDQLDVALKIFAFGKDHVEVARLTAKQQGISLGLKGQELSLYVSEEMILRNIVIATEEKAEAVKEAANAAAEFAKVDISAGVKSAAEAAQRLAKHLGISLRSAMSMQGLISTRRTEDVFDPRDPRNQGSDASTERARRLMEGGTLDSYPTSPESTTGGGSGGSTQTVGDYLDQLQKEQAHKNTLVGLTKEEITASNFEFTLRKKISTLEGKTTNERLESIIKTETATRKLMETEEERRSTMDMVEGHIESAFMAMVDGSKSVEDAFKGMLRNIISDIYQQQIAKPAATAIGGFLKDLLFSANGNVFSGGSQVKAYANGGVVNGPTTFPMTGGQTGLMGEAGPEAIMPLKRGANGKLGVQAEGGRSGDVININQSFNFQANGDDTVKKLIAQAAPKIADMAKASVIDSRRRGGSTKAAFG